MQIDKQTEINFYQIWLSKTIMSRRADELASEAIQQVACHVVNSHSVNWQWMTPEIFLQRRYETFFVTKA